MHLILAEAPAARLGLLYGVCKQAIGGQTLMAGSGSAHQCREVGLVSVSGTWRARFVTARVTQ